MAKNLLEVRKLTKKYGKKTVVKGISFEVKEGEIFGILGPNGAGKTTTLEMIETMRPIDSGTVTLAGLDVSDKPEQIKQIIGVQLQSTAFIEKLTLVELLNMCSSFYGQRERPMKLLKDMELTDKS